MRFKYTVSLTITTIALLTLAACGGGDDDDNANGAGAFMADVIEQQLKGQHGPVYDQLHPAQQEVVDRDFFIECRSGSTFPAVEVSVDEVYDETMDVPQVGGVDTRAVTLEFTGEDINEYRTFHAVDVDGEWHWILGSDAINAIQQGNCP